MDWIKFAPLVLVGEFTKKKPTIDGAVFRSKKGQKLFDVKIKHLFGGYFLMHSPEKDLHTTKKEMQKTIKGMQETIGKMDEKMKTYSKGN